jgi:hypothetical protein
MKRVILATQIFSRHASQTLSTSLVWSGYRIKDVRNCTATYHEYSQDRYTRFDEGSLLHATEAITE